jgi:hypothetical protein
VRYNGPSVWIDEEPTIVLPRGPLEVRSEVEKLKEVTKH